MTCRRRNLKTSQPCYNRAAPHLKIFCTLLHLAEPHKIAISCYKMIKWRIYVHYGELGQSMRRRAASRAGCYHLHIIKICGGGGVTTLFLDNA